MSWLDLAVQVVPDSLIQRAKAIQETLRFEQVEKERQARLGEEIRRKNKGQQSGKGERKSRSVLNGSETIFGRRGPNRSIVRRPIGNNGATADLEVAIGFFLLDGDTVTVYSGDGSASAETTLPYFDFPTVPDPSSAWLAGLNEDPTKPAGAIWSDVPTEGHAANALSDPNRRVTTPGTIIGTGTRSFRNEAKIAEYNYGLEYFYSLPVAADACLLVYVAKGDKGFTRFQCGWDVNYSFELLFSEVISDVTVNTYQLVDSASYVGPVSTFYVDEYDHKRCWLISKSSVRAVAVPSGLAARLNVLHEIPPRGTITLPTDGFFVDPPPSLPWPPASVTTSGPTADPFGVPALYGPLATSIQLSPLLSYGLIPNDINIDIYGAPSIFSYLTAFNKTDAPGLDEDGNYAEARNSYFPAAPAPLSPFLRQCMLPGTCDPAEGIYGFDQTIVSPESVTAALALDSTGYMEAQIPKVTNILDNLTQYTRVAAWDWRNPAYCMDRLLSLGFDPEDLVP
jgi:hypothetical protein